jgi:fibronectin-binding autotransporter adhesin
MNRHGMRNVLQAASISAVLLAAWLAASAAQAGPLYFSTSSGYTTWDNATTPAWGGSGGPYEQNWAPGSDAHFEGLAGSVTVTGTVGSVNSITFDTDGYTLAHGAGGTITLTGGGIIQTGAGSATIGAILAGSVGLTKTGSGTLAISGAAGHPSYSGITTISAGTLLLMGDYNLLNNASIPIVVQDGATLSNSGPNAAQNIQALTLNGSATVSGNQDWLLNQTVMVPDGPNTATITAVSELAQIGGTVFNIGSGAASGINLDVQGAIGTAWGANQGMIKAGSGVMRLGGANTYTAATTVNSGALLLANSAALQSTVVTLNLDNGLQFAPALSPFTFKGLSGSGSLSLADTAGGAVAISVGNNNASTTYSGNLGGSGSLTKTGTGTFTLAGSAIHTGGTTVSAGTLQIGAGGDLGSITGNVTNQAAMVFSRSGTYACTAAIGGNGTVTQAGSGTLVFSGSGMSYSGATTISAGTLRLADVTGFASNIADAAALEVYASDTTTLSGHNDLLSGTGTLTKTGTGTLVLSCTWATINFTGAVAVNTGNLTLTGNYNVLMGARSITVQNGATMTASGWAQNIPALTLAGGTMNATGNPWPSWLLNGNVTLPDNTGTSTISASSVALNHIITFYVGTGDTLAVTGGMQVGTTGGLTKDGPGLMDLSGAEGVGANGPTNVLAGTLLLRGQWNMISASTAVTVAQGATLACQNLAQHIQALTLTGGALTGSGDGYGSWLFNNDVTVSGGTATSTISAVNMGLYDGAGTNPVPTRFTVNPGAANGIDLDVPGTFEGSWNSALGIIKDGSGVMRVSGASTFAGPVQISAGTLTVPNLANGSVASGIGASTNNAGSLVLDGGTLQYSGGGTSTNRLFTLTGNGGTLDASGAGAVNFTNAGALAFTGSGPVTLNLSGTSTAANTLTPIISDGTGGATSVLKQGPGTWVLANTNTYSGGTTIAAGTLGVTKDIALGAATAPLVFSGTAALRASADLTLGASRSILVGAGATAGFDAACSINAAGVISGSGGLAKLGAGKLTLSVSNSYAGLTDVIAGTLQYGRANAIPSANSVVVSGGNLNTGGFNSDLANLQLAGGAVSGGGQITSTSNFDVRAGTIATNLAGNVDMVKSTSGTAAVVTAQSYGGATVISAGTLQFTADPAHQAYQATNTMANQPYNGSLGCGFTVNTPIVVTQLGFYDSGLDGLTTSHVVMLTDNTSGSNVYATETVPLGTAGMLSGGYRFVTLPTPITLGTGMYRVWGDNYSIDNNFNGAAINTSTGPTDQGSKNEVTFNGNSYFGASGLFPNDGVYPSSYLFGAASFLYTDTALAGSLPSTTPVRLSGSGTLDLGGFSQTVGSLSSTDATTTVALGTATLTVGNGTSGTCTFAGTISGAGTLAVADGTLVLTGSNISTGSTTVNAGTLQIGAGGASGSVSGDIANNAVVFFHRSDIYTYAGRLSGSGTVTQAGSGILVLSNTGNMQASTVLTAGEVSVSSDGNLGSGIVFNGGMLQVTGTALANIDAHAVNWSSFNGGFDIADAAATLTVAGSINGSGSLTKIGSGTLVVANMASTYTGGTTLEAGVLQVGDGSTADGSLGGVDGQSGDVSLYAGSTLRFANHLTQGCNGVLSGSGAVVKIVGGTLVLGGSNTFTGGLTINAGTLQLSNSGALGPAGAVVTLGGGTLDLGGVNPAVGTLDSSPESTIALGAATLAVGDGDVNSTLAGTITGTGGGLLIHGTGTTLLGGSNSFSGMTGFISVGTLALANSQALSMSTIDFTGGGNLTFGSLTAATLGGLTGANYNITGLDNRLRLANASGTAVTLSVGNNGDNTIFAGDMLGSGSLVKIGSGTLTLSGTDSYEGGTTVLGGTLDIASVSALPGNSTLAIANTAEVIFATDLGSAIQLSLMLPGAGGGEPGLTYFHVTAAPVPEPGALVLLAAAALAGAAVWRGRMRNRK